MKMSRQASQAGSINTRFQLPPSIHDHENSCNLQPFPTNKGCSQHSVALSKSPVQIDLFHIYEVK